MRCPYCRSDDTKVIDSRDTEEGGAIRRRRECGACRQRFTTFERAEGVSLVVPKGHRAVQVTGPTPTSGTGDKRESTVFWDVGIDSGSRGAGVARAMRIA